MPPFNYRDRLDKTREVSDSMNSLVASRLFMDVHAAAPEGSVQDERLRGRGGSGRHEEENRRRRSHSLPKIVEQMRRGTASTGATQDTLPSGNSCPYPPSQPRFEQQHCHQHHPQHYQSTSYFTAEQERAFGRHVDPSTDTSTLTPSTTRTTPVSSSEDLVELGGGGQLFQDSRQKQELLSRSSSCTNRERSVGPSKQTPTTGVPVPTPTMSQCRNDYCTIKGAAIKRRKDSVDENDNVIVLCQCGDCVPRFCRSHHQAHVCPLRTVSCPFAKLGCPVTSIAARELPAHEASHMQEHLQLTVTRMMEYEHVMSDLNKSMQTLQKENASLKTKNTELTKAHQSLVDQQERHQHDHDQQVAMMETSIAAIAKQVSILEQDRPRYYEDEAPPQRSLRPTPPRRGSGGGGGVRRSGSYGNASRSSSGRSPPTGRPYDQDQRQYPPSYRNSRRSLAEDGRCRASDDYYYHPDEEEVGYGDPRDADYVIDAEPRGSSKHRHSSYY